MQKNYNTTKRHTENIEIKDPDSPIKKFLPKNKLRKITLNNKAIADLQN